MAITLAGPSYSPDLLAAGQETIPRELATTNTAATTSGILRLTYFTARSSYTSTQGRMWSGGTAAAATPTLVRWGLYLVPASGDSTLVAAIANDTTLFAATGTAYTRNWTTPYAVIAGQRYAHGVIVVTGAAAPTLVGAAAHGTAENLEAPRLHGALSGQTDLPAALTGGHVITASASRHYAVILP